MNLLKYVSFKSLLSLMMIGSVLFVSSCGGDDEAKPVVKPVTLDSLVAAFSGSPLSIEEGKEVTFSDKSTGKPTSWKWTFTGGDPSESTEKNPKVTYAANGKYAVKLVVTRSDDDATSTSEVAEYITVTEAAPLADVVAKFSVSSQEIFVGDSVTFTDLSTESPDGWSWIFEKGDPATSDAQNPVVKYSEAGTYKVTLKASRSGDPVSEDTKVEEAFITVKPLETLVADFSSLSTTIVAGDSVIFKNESAGNPDGFAWVFTDAVVAASVDENPVVFYETVGTHAVKLTVTRTADGGEVAEEKTGFVTVIAQGTQAAYNSTPQAIPGELDMARYDIGGQDVAFNDSDVLNNTAGKSGEGPRSGEPVELEQEGDSVNVGWQPTGEWVEYTVNVQTTGNYTIEYRIANAPGEASLQLQNEAGAALAPPLAIDATGGWQVYTTLKQTGVSLTAGEQVIRLAALGPKGANTRFIKFTLE